MSGGTRPGHESRFEDLPARGGAGPRCRATRGLVSRGRLRLCPDECVARGPGRVDRRAPSGGDRESLWDDRVQQAHCLGRTRAILKQPRLVVGLEFDGYVRSHGHLWVHDCRHHPSVLHRLRRAPPGLLCTAHGHAGLRARGRGPNRRDGHPDGERRPGPRGANRALRRVGRVDLDRALGRGRRPSDPHPTGDGGAWNGRGHDPLHTTTPNSQGSIWFSRPHSRRQRGRTGSGAFLAAERSRNGSETTGICLARVVLVGTSLLLAYQGLGPRAGFGYWNLGFLGTIVVLVVGAAVGMLLFGGVGRPSFVAVAADGFRLWYDSPYDRHLNDTVFPWDEIVDIHMTSGKGAHWVLRRTTGEFTNLYMLKGRNLNLLLKEWATRRTPSGS